MNSLFSSAPRILLIAVLPSLALSAPNRPATPEPASKKSKDEALPDTHRVLRGESLWGIAMKHNTSVGEIMEINHMDEAQVKEGQLLKLRRPSETASGAGAQKLTHTVHEGDTLRSIAKDHHVTENDILKVNPNLNSKTLKNGTKVTIPDATPGSKTVTGKGLINHTVKSGETFYSIAKQHQTNVDDVMAANPSIKPDRVYEGLVIKIPLKEQSNSANQDSPKKTKTSATEAAKNDSNAKKPAIPATAAAKPKEEPVTNKTAKEEPKITKAPPTPPSKPVQAPVIDPPKPAPTNNEVRSYTVSEGETPDSIATKHRINAKRLLEYNRLPSDASLRAGDEIMIPSSSSVVKR